MKKSNWIRQKPAFYSRLNVHQFSSVYFQSYYNNLSSITIYSFTFILFVMLRMKRVFYKLIWCRNWLLCTAFIDTICIKFRISLAIDYNQKQMCRCVPQWLNCFVSFHSCFCFTFFFFKWSFILTNNVRVLWARTLLFLFYFINMPFSRFVEFFHHSRIELCTQYVDRIRTSVVDSIQLPFDKIKKKRNITNFSLHSFSLTLFVCVCVWMNDQ